MNRNRLIGLIIEATRQRFADGQDEGDFDDAERHYRDDAKDPELVSAFCTEVGYVVRKQYGHDDGSDLCWSLIEMGTIDVDSVNVELAAATVAGHLEQP